MRKILTLVMLVGAVGTLMAQASTAAVPDARRVMAGQMEIVPSQHGAASTVRMSGGITIVFEDGTRVTADAGTLIADGQTVELSGNVRLTFPKPTPQR